MLSSLSLLLAARWPELITWSCPMAKELGSAGYCVLGSRHVHWWCLAFLHHCRHGAVVSRSAFQTENYFTQDGAIPKESQSHPTVCAITSLLWGFFSLKLLRSSMYSGGCLGIGPTWVQAPPLCVALATFGFSHLTVSPRFLV